MCSFFSHSNLGGGTATAAPSACCPSFALKASQNKNAWFYASSELTGASSSTLEYWYKSTESPTHDKYLIWSAYISTLVRKSDGAIGLNCWRRGVHFREYSSGHASVLDGKWHHLIFVKEGSTVKGYVDGKLGLTNTGCDRLFGDLRFGNHACEISLISGYKRALGAAEIAQPQKLCKNEDGLVSRYLLKASETNDQFGSGKDMKLDGGSLSSASDSPCGVLDMLKLQVFLLPILIVFWCVRFFHIQT